MKVAELIRHEEGERGVIGILKIDKEVFCYTLELPDKMNKINEGCIPNKQYKCERIISPKFGETFEITNVPGRSYILFHKGNTVDDTSGCVILGSEVGKLRGQRAVLNSGRTFEQFMAIMADKSMFHLTIKTEY